jgi:hypothetical protein
MKSIIIDKLEKEVISEKGLMLVGIDLNKPMKIQLINK